MTQVRRAAIAASTLAGAALFSFGWSEQGGVSLSVESAQARVGRPLTPVSVAGVARRQNRRAAYGAGAVGAGLAAGGTAAVAAGTSPWGWGWGDGPYVGTGYYGGRVAARTAYYGGGPYVGTGYYGGPLNPNPNARPLYPSASAGVGPSPVVWPSGVSSSDRDLYTRNLRDSGWDRKKDFNPNGTIRTQ